MAAIDFPSSPTVGQTFTSGGVTWMYDGVKWTSTSAATGLYLPLTGGTMQGDLILNRDAQVALGAATLEQVQARGSGANRIINGDMRIDQRNNGVAGTAVGYTIDRWQFHASLATKGTWQRAGALLGFGASLSFTSNSAYTVAAGDFFDFHQRIEADMITDFQWGTPQAQPVTLSFWAFSTVAGMFGGVIKNAAADRSYAFSYTLAASTWTRIIITIPGDTAGTWVMSGNGVGLYLMLAFGCGSTYAAPSANAWVAGNYIAPPGTVSVVGANGANFILTGVKLEIGSIATPFNRKSPQESLADCQRYCYRVGSTTAQVLGTGYCASTTLAGIVVSFPVTMRDLPVNSASSGAGFQISGTATTNITPVLGTTTTNGMQVNFTCAGLTTGVGAIATVNANNWMAFTAEL